MMDPTEVSADNEWLADRYVAAYPENLPFWEAARTHKLVLPMCGDCKRCHWYPRTVCPLCGGLDISWAPSLGRGTVHSFSIQRRCIAKIILAYVRLEEGPVLMTNIVDCAFDDVAIGMKVQVKFLRTPEGRHAPFFAPASDLESDPALEADTRPA
ncbi:MAG: OB-fold domain-containing protein [Pseudomonadota bacterium]